MSDPQPPVAVPPVVSDDLKPDPSNPAPNPIKDNVSYETHRRLLDEKKKVQAERDALAKDKEDRERKEMEAKGEYQKLLDAERNEKKQLADKLSAHERSMLEAKKFHALHKALDGSVDEKYWGFLPIDKVLVDPDTGEVNAASVAEAASIVKTNYPELLRRKGGPNLPNEAPKGNDASTITETDWKKLSGTDMGKWKFNQIRWGE